MKKIDNMDKLLPLVVREIVEKENESFSCSEIQRTFNVSYPRSARIVDQMREMGIVTETKPLKLNISLEEYSQLLEMCDGEYAKLQRERFDESVVLAKKERQTKEKIVEELKKLELEKIELFDCKGQKLSDNYTLKVISFIENSGCLDAEDVQVLKDTFSRNNYKLKSVEFGLDEEMEIRQKLEIKSSIVLCSVHSSAPYSGFVSSKIESVIDKFNGDLLLLRVNDDNPEEVIILF